jgi:hypothetical protein
MSYLKLFRSGAASLLILLACAAHASAQPADPAASDEALKQGLAAAKSSQFPLALEYFTTAQKADPERSDIWFNLGLASAKIPGHEFRAIAFFEAYLLEKPDAPRRAAIEQSLKQLGLPIEAKILTLLDELKAMDQADPRYEARAGYADRAIKTLDAREHRPGFSEYLYGDPGKGKTLGSYDGRFAFELARGGSLPQAETYLSKYEDWIDQTLAQTHEPISYNYGVDLQLAYRGLMAAYARQNDFAKATALYERFKRRIGFIQSVAHNRISATVTAGLYACLQSNTRDGAGSFATLNAWRDAMLANRIGAPGEIFEQDALEIVADSQHAAHDEQGAKETMKQHPFASSADFGSSQRAADKMPGNFKVGEMDYDSGGGQESLRCWRPSQRKRDLLSLGLNGFDLCDGSELDVAKCVSKIKNGSSASEIESGLSSLVNRITEVYANIRYRGKHWQF